MIPEVTNTRFTVAICTLDRRAYLERAASEVLRQLAAFPHGALLIVDNGSTDGTPEYLRALSRSHNNVSFLHEERRGVYFARARAMEAATGEFLLFIDDDAIPAPGWLATMLGELTASPDVGAVGCAIDPLWEAPRPKWLSNRLMREIPAYDVDGDRIPAQFPAYPPSIALGIRLNACARLFTAPARRQDYPLGRQGTDAQRPRLDTDLCEIYSRNCYRVLFIGSTRVQHAVPASRLNQGWYVRKFASEGHLRIRLLRLAGYPVIGRHSIQMLGALPLLALLRPFQAVLPAVKAVLVRAYYAKCLAAWRELLSGPRVKPLPYRCGGSSGGPTPPG
jgi:glycosyltransferase involved in cell wall biosynthesis